MGLVSDWLRLMMLESFGAVNVTVIGGFRRWGSRLAGKTPKKKNWGNSCQLVLKCQIVRVGLNRLAKPTSWGLVMFHLKWPCIFFRNVREILRPVWKMWFGDGDLNLALSIQILIFKSLCPNRALMIINDQFWIYYRESLLTHPKLLILHIWFIFIV